MLWRIYFIFNRIKDLDIHILSPFQQKQFNALFNEEEVMGKYLDLQPIFDSATPLIRKWARARDEDMTSKK